jgi:hypothetical protein
VVLHLVDWSEAPKPFTLMVDPERLFGDVPLKIHLLRPKPYVRSEHVAADATGDYRELSSTVPLGQGRVATVDIPALTPWGMVLIEADPNDQQGVWQPRIWADEDACFADRLVVKMDCASPEATIRYTTDGSQPTLDSRLYAEPFSLAQSATLRAAAFTQTGSSLETTATFTKLEGTSRPLQPDAAIVNADLQLWLRADTLIDTLADGSAVARWPAVAGPAAVVPSAKLRSGILAAAPTLVINAITGQPAIRFDGVDDQLAIPSFANDHLADTAFTILLVTQSPTSAFGICGNGLTGTGGIPRLYLTRSTFRYDVLDKGPGPRVPDGWPAISTFTHDGRETIAAYVDGRLSGRQSGRPLVGAFGGGNLALPFWSGNVNQAGDIAEIIVFGRELTGDERQGVEAYLAAKYQIRHQRKWR